MPSSVYSKHVLSDPSAFEEPLLDDTVTVVMDHHGGFISVSHVGEGLQGQEAGEDVVRVCMQKAKARHEEVFDKIFGQ